LPPRDTIPISSDSDDDEEEEEASTPASASKKKKNASTAPRKRAVPAGQGKKKKGQARPVKDEDGVRITKGMMLGDFARPGEILSGEQDPQIGSGDDSDPVPDRPIDGMTRENLPSLVTPVGHTCNMAYDVTFFGTSAIPNIATLSDIKTLPTNTAKIIRRKGAKPVKSVVGLNSKGSNVGIKYDISIGAETIFGVDQQGDATWPMVVIGRVNDGVKPTMTKPVQIELGLTCKAAFSATQKEASAVIKMLAFKKDNLEDSRLVRLARSKKPNDVGTQIVVNWILNPIKIGDALWYSGKVQVPRFVIDRSTEKATEGVPGEASISILHNELFAFEIKMCPEGRQDGPSVVGRRKEAQHAAVEIKKQAEKQEEEDFINEFVADVKRVETEEEAQQIADHEAMQTVQQPEGLFEDPTLIPEKQRMTSNQKAKQPMLAMFDDPFRPRLPPRSSYMPPAAGGHNSFARSVTANPEEVGPSGAAASSSAPTAPAERIPDPCVLEEWPTALRLVSNGGTYPDDRAFRLGNDRKVLGREWDSLTPQWMSFLSPLFNVVSEGGGTSALGMIRLRNNNDDAKGKTVYADIIPCRITTSMFEMVAQTLVNAYSLIGMMLHDAFNGRGLTDVEKVQQLIHIYNETNRLNPVRRLAARSAFELLEGSIGLPLNHPEFGQQLVLPVMYYGRPVAAAAPLPPTGEVQAQASAAPQSFYGFPAVTPTTTMGFNGILSNAMGMSLPATPTFESSPSHYMAGTPDNNGWHPMLSSCAPNVQSPSFSFGDGGHIGGSSSSAFPDLGSGSAMELVASSSSSSGQVEFDSGEIDLQQYQQQQQHQSSPQKRQDTLPLAPRTSVSPTRSTFIPPLTGRSQVIKAQQPSNLSSKRRREEEDGHGTSDGENTSDRRVKQRSEQVQMPASPSPAPHAVTPRREMPPELRAVNFQLHLQPSTPLPPSGYPTPR
jgi:hypothetical protein